MAKGITNATIPFGGVAFSDEVYSAFEGKPFPHGFTYAAHPIGCAAGIATIDYYLTNNVAEKAAKVGEHIKQRLETEFLPLPCVGLVEGRGVFQAIELVNDKKSKTPIKAKAAAEFLKKLFDNGIWTRIQGPASNRLQICPPCTITMEEADKALDILKPIISELKPQ